MPEQLPILTELRADLDAAFHATPRRPRRRWLLPAGGGLSLAGAAAAVLALTSGHVASPPSARAAEVLRRVALVAGRTASPVPRDDQFYFFHSTGFGAEIPDNAGAIRTDQDQSIWTSIDRAGLNRTLVKHVEPLSPRDARKPREPIAFPPGMHSFPLDPARHYYIGVEPLTRAQLLAFPTDPAWLYHHVLAHTDGRGPSPTGETFVELGDALRGPAPAPLRAGLYRALALVPGVELAGRVTDRAGRPGIAVSHTEEGVRHELVFDPRTSEMLAEREVLVDPTVDHIDEPAGTVLQDTVYLQRGVTDDLKPPPR
jgi:hypothetical protein